MKVYDIKWDIDLDEACDKLEAMPVMEAASVIQSRRDLYANTSREDRRDMAKDYFRHRPGALEDFMGLPNELELPENLTDEEDISNWLSDTYGFCHNGFSLSNDKKSLLTPKRGEVISSFDDLRDIDPGTFNFR